MKFFLLTIIFVNNAFATNYVNEFPTYVYGDIRPIAAIYNSIAMITSSDIYQNLIYLAILFSTVSIGWMVTVGKDLVGALKGGSFTIGSIAVLLVPVDVHLVDKRLDFGLINNYYQDHTLGYEKISNVPWLIALTPSIATTISTDLIQLTNQAFKGNTVNYSGMKDIGKTGYSELGYNKAFDMINTIVDKYSFEKIGTQDASNFKKDFKIYLVDCVIPKTVSNTIVTTNLISPTKDIYTSLSPTEIGLTASDEAVKRDGSTTDCVSFYTEIMGNLKGLNTDTYKTLSRLTGVTDIKSVNGLNNIMLADIQSTVFSNTTEQLAIYAQNLAAAPLIKATIEDYYRGTGMSGQEIANSITAAKSTSSLQTQGLGQFKWMAQILPFAMHFLFGIILASSLFTLLMIVARGTRQGGAIARNYFGGFIQFEAIRVSTALVNNLVMYYATISAVDKLTEFSGNPLTVLDIPSYLDYIATMEGVSGILAVSAIFLIPAIAMKGDVASIASSMQGISGRYVGNDVETSRDATSKSSARQRAVGNVLNDEQAMKKLDQMGLTVPKERMPLEYYNSVTNDLSLMSSGIGNMLSQDKMDNFAKGTTANTASKISNTAGYGSSVNLSSAENVAFQDGQVQGFQTNATEDYRNKANWDANKVGTGKAIQGVGKDVSAMATTDLASSDSGFDSYAKGSYNQGAMSTAKTQAVGGLNLSTEDLNKIGDTVKASIQSEIGKGQGVQDNIKKYGEDAYKTSSEYGERSNLAKTMEKISAQGGVDNAVKLDATDSMIKAIQQTGSIGGTMASYEEAAKSSGKSIGKVIEDLSKDLTQGKISSDIATVDYANANGGYVNFQKKSALEKTSTAITTLDGKTGSMIDESGKLTEDGKKTVKEMSEGKAKADIRTVKEYDKNNKEHGGYVGAQVDNASIKAGQDIANLNAQRKENFINNDGLTEKGIQSYGISPTEQAAILDAKHSTFYGKNADATANNIVNALKDISKRDATLEATNKARENKLNEEDTKKFVDEYVNNKLQEVDNKLKELGMMGNDKKPQSGDAMVGALSKMGAMNYASSKSLTFDGKNITMGIDSSTGEAKVFNSSSSSNVKSGDSDNFDNVNTASTGKKRDSYNNTTSLHNTDPLTTLALARFGGDLQKAANWARSAEGTKWALDPRNEIALAAAESSNLVIPQSKQGEHGESSAMVAAGVGAAGVGLYALDKFTKKPIKMDTNELNPITDKEGKIQGYEDSEGNRVADKNGYKLDEDGKKVKKGIVSRTGSNVWDKLGEFKDDLLSSKDSNKSSPTSFTTENKTPDSSTDNDGSKQTNSSNDRTEKEMKTENVNEHNDSSNKYNKNYNTSDSQTGQNSSEKSLNQQKIDLANKNPESLARETFGKQAEMKAKENLDNFRNGSIDKQTFSQKNAELSSFMSKVENGMDITPKELESMGIKPTSDMPLETKMSKNNKPFQVINTSAYGEQLKEIEAQKLRGLDTKVSTSSNNPSINENSMKPTEVQHPKIENFITEAEAKTAGVEIAKKLPLVGKVTALALAGVTLSEASEHFNNGEYGKAFFTTTSIADITGASDMALATIESRELQDKITGGRKVESIGNWQDDMKKVAVRFGNNLNGLFSSSNEDTNNSVQNVVSPKMVQSQLNVIPDAMNFIGNEQPQQMAQKQVLQQVYDQYKHNNENLANGSITQDQFYNNNMHLNSIAQNTMMNRPISQTSMEYAGLNTQNMPFENGNLNMQSYGQSLNSSNFSDVLRDGQVRNELSNIYSQQQEQNRMMNSSDEQIQRLQMMEMRNSIGKVSEKMKTLEDINFTSEDLELLRTDLKKMRMRGN